VDQAFWMFPHVNILHFDLVKQYHAKITVNLSKDLQFDFCTHFPQNSLTADYKHQSLKMKFSMSSVCPYCYSQSLQQLVYCPVHHVPTYLTKQTNRMCFTSGVWTVESQSEYPGVRVLARCRSMSLPLEWDSDSGLYLFYLDCCVILLQSIWLLCNLFYN